MFDWFKKPPQTPNALATANVPDILEKYGALMEKHPTAYIDETWLPVPKARMRLVFKSAWKMAPDATLRNHIELAWTFLSHFQPGIGETPVDGTPRHDLSSENMANFDRWIELSKIGLAESERDMKAIRELLANN
jgi:hypothetical protein